MTSTESAVASSVVVTRSAASVVPSPMMILKFVRPESSSSPVSTIVSAPDRGLSRMLSADWISTEPGDAPV